jgi:proline dehydrogenase
VIENLKQNNVYSILDYSVEGSLTELDFENTVEKCLDILVKCSEFNLSNFLVFKPSAVGKFSLYEKVSNGDQLSENEMSEWSRVEGRFDRICSFASKKQIMVLVDAEESWIQPAIDKIVLKMMLNYNRDKTVVYNTLQAYRNDRFDFLLKTHESVQSKNIKIGIKLVRGAYMEKERSRAIRKNYDSPICKIKDETDQLFNKSMKYILRNIDDFSLFIGSHNEYSNKLAVELVEKSGLRKNDQRLWFSQLYGMSDNISFTLAKNGFNVAKYLPFGPVKEVVPYLIRRLDENSSVSTQTNRELQLISSEIKRRKS